MSAISAIFGTFARTHPITLKLYQNIEKVLLIKNHEKKLAIIMIIWPKLAFEISKIGKISKIAKISKVSEFYVFKFQNPFLQILIFEKFRYFLRLSTCMVPKDQSKTTRDIGI